jgi:hypothetical protein
MKRQLCITVRGKQHRWNFHFEGDEKHLQEWRDDGLEVYVVYNSIPLWLPSWAMKLWCFVQDVFNFRNPFAA